MKKAIFIIIGLIIFTYVFGLFVTKEIYTEINIDASPQEVWNHLTAFERYPDWNPFVTHISGEGKEGSKIRVAISPPGKNSMDFAPELVVVNQNEELRWLGRWLLPGLFDGEHYFKIEENSDGGVRFIHGEHFKGILALMLWSSIESETRQGFEAMNRGLKKRWKPKRRCNKPPNSFAKLRFGDPFDFCTAFRVPLRFLI
ncbi:MAG: SRPBCC family protein [bacterium]